MIFTAEEWRPIEGFPLYEISNAGRVRSLKRGDGQPRILAQSAQPTGHLRCHLREPGTSKSRFRYVHRLVLEAFVGPGPDGTEVRHLDGNPANNHVSNLCYGTRSENCMDRVRHGTHPQARKTHCPQGHEYSPENTRINARGARHCRICESTRWGRNLQAQAGAA